MTEAVTGKNHADSAAWVATATWRSSICRYRTSVSAAASVSTIGAPAKFSSTPVGIDLSRVGRTSVVCTRPGCWVEEEVRTPAEWNGPTAAENCIALDSGVPSAIEATTRVGAPSAGRGPAAGRLASPARTAPIRSSSSVSEYPGSRVLPRSTRDRSWSAADSAIWAPRSSSTGA